MRELILGGARSGKSALAVQRALASNANVIYLATASATDAEMALRIARHVRDRPAHWSTLEVSTGLAEALRQVDGREVFVIVDCLTLWLSNVLCAPTSSAAPAFCEAAWQQERMALLDCLPTLQAQVVLVSNEVGLSIVPDNPVARRFRDEQGWLNQAVAACCEQVCFVAAGLPIMLKSAVTARQ